MSAAAGAVSSAAPAVSVAGAAVRRGGRTVWREVTCTVGPGEFAAVLGPNGAGKSTLLQALLGLLPLSAGRAEVLGRPPGGGDAEVGYLPQRRSFGAETRLSGRDTVALGLDGDRWGVPLPFGATRRRRAQRVRDAIAMVGAEGYAHRPIGRLSGGEQQRLLIAQALVARPSLLLLDEPLDGLDLPNQSAVAALLQRICRREGVATLLVAHDVNPILAYLDRVIYFAGSTAVEGPPDEVITDESLSRLYGVPIEVLRASDGRMVVVGGPEAPHQHGARHGG
jgi:zinc/manganese transport system ATP-binding protein